VPTLWRAHAAARRDPAPDATEAILDCLELPSRAPPTAPAVPDAEEWAADFDATL
jgi:hypothetical protein